MSHAIEVDAVAWTRCHMCHTALPTNAAFCGECGEAQVEPGQEIALDVGILKDAATQSAQPMVPAPAAARRGGRVTATYAAIGDEPDHAYTPEPTHAQVQEAAVAGDPCPEIEMVPELEVVGEIELMPEAAADAGPRDPYPALQAMLRDLVAECDASPPSPPPHPASEPIVHAAEYRHLDEDDYAGVLGGAAPDRFLALPPKRTRSAAACLIVPVRAPAEDQVADSLRTGEFATTPLVVAAFLDVASEPSIARQRSTAPPANPALTHAEPPSATECTVLARAPLPPAPYWHAPPKGDTVVGPAPKG